MKGMEPRRSVQQLEIVAALLAYAILFAYGHRPGVHLLPACITLALLLLSERWQASRPRRRVRGTAVAFRWLLCTLLFLWVDPMTTPILLAATLPGLFEAVRNPSAARLAIAVVVPLAAALPAFWLHAPASLVLADAATSLTGPLALAAIGIVIVVKSLVERQHSSLLVREQLGMHERQLRQATLLEALDEPIFLLDRDFRILESNPNAVENIGEGMRGRFLTELVQTPEGHEPVPHTGHAPGPAGFHAVEVYLIAGHGRGQQWSLDIRELPEGGGHAWVAVLHRSAGMLERVRMGEDRYRRLQQASTRQHSFLRLMSYELRTPLTSILGFSELLGMPQVGNLGIMQRSRLDVIHRSGRHLLAILDDVREFVRLGERPPPSRVQLDLGEIAEEGARLVAASVESNGLLLELDRPPEPVPALGDRRMTTQMVLNLLTNAIRFTAKGGVIRLSVSRSGDRSEVVVEDTGTGIPWSEQGEIFEPFVLGQNRSGDAAGAGMGLAITRRLAEVQGGTISLRSRPGQGSTFVVCLHAPHGALDDPSSTFDLAENELLQTGDS